MVCVYLEGQVLVTVALCVAFISHIYLFYLFHAYLIVNAPSFLLFFLSSIAVYA